MMEYAIDSAFTTSNNSSRTFSLRALESFTRESAGESGSLRIVAAITNGPAHGPLPASSTPAIRDMPDA